jgi:hypothetical protein
MAMTPAAAFSAAVEHHDTMTGLSQNDGKIDGEIEVVELWRWRLTGYSGEAQIRTRMELWSLGRL